MWGGQGSPEDRKGEARQAEEEVGTVPTGGREKRNVILIRIQGKERLPVLETLRCLN